MAIRVLVTGGTFDKEYNEITESLNFRETHLPEMLALGRSRVGVTIETVMLIDSLTMTNQDRELIIRRCQEVVESQIVITHGTGTMELTAQALGPIIRDKTVVLTGAMVPYKFGTSDGLFNLGSALAFAQTLPNGVYVAMHGRYFEWHNVHKNINTGEFVELKP